MAADRPRLKDAGLQAATSAVGATVGLAAHGPAEVVLASLAQPAADFLARFVLNVVSRRQKNVEAVIALAAREASLEPKELVRRVDSGGYPSELFLRTLRVAQDAGTVPKLVALALSVAKVAVSSDDAELSREAVIVRAIEDLDSVDLRILRSFTEPRRLFGDGVGTPYGDDPPDRLGEATLVRRFPEIGDTVWAVVANLQAFVALSGVSARGPDGGGGRSWTITSFGAAFVERMRVAEDFLRV